MEARSSLRASKPRQTVPPRRERRRSRIGWWLAASALAVTALAIHQRSRRAERRHPPVGRFIDIDGVRVHYAAKGEGRPVVLIHGNGTMVHDWMVSGLFDRLARERRVIAIDRPGYGYTERPRDRLWTASVQAELLRRTLQELGVEKPVVVGHSWGAIVALAYALDHGDEVSGLVLLSGYYWPTIRPDVWAFAPPALPVVGDVMRYTVSPLLVRLIAPRIIRKSFAPLPVPRRFAMRFPLPLAFRPSQIRASAEDSALMVPTAAYQQDRYSELRLPVVIVTGEADRMVTPARQSLRLHEAIEGSELTLVPGVGHMIQYSAHDEIVEAVRTVADRPSRAEHRPPLRKPTGTERSREPLRA